jgi:hypothetical protein
MIKRIIALLFAKELKSAKDEAIAEVRDILASAKVTAKKQYVKYDRFELDSAEFLYGIQPLFDNKYLTCWILERQREYDRLTKYGDTLNREMNIGRSMAIDELQKDLEIFRSRMEDILEELQTQKA